MRRWYATYADDPKDLFSLFRVDNIRFYDKGRKSDIWRIEPYMLIRGIVAQTVVNR